jgi:excisionase family DNA binding protein
MSTNSWRMTWTGGAAPPTPAVASAPGPSVASAPDWHLLSIKEVATACQLSEKAVRRAIDAGELPAVKLRSRLRVVPQDLEAWIASCRQSGRHRTTEFRPRLGRRPAGGTFRALVDSDREAEL